MPQGSGVPATKSAASWSAAMYDVSAVMTSVESESERTVERTSSAVGDSPGLSAVNSGSVVTVRGVVSRPGCARPEFDPG